MPEVTLTRQRIEPGKLDRLREWMAELRNREDEAVDTLQAEGVLTESAFLERTDDGDYLVYYLEAEDVERALETYEASDRDLDEEHRQVMADVLADDTGGGDRGCELLYHFTDPDRG